MTWVGAALIGVIVWLMVDKLQFIKNKSIRLEFRTKRVHDSPLDYSVYEMSLQEIVSSIFIAFLVLGFAGIVFYKNLFVALILSILSILYPRVRRQQLLRRRKEILTQQFKQALSTLSSSLAAGKSVENAFVDTSSDLKLLYPEGSSFILQELERINERVRNGDSLEKSLIDFAKRAEVDDITNFAEVFSICKRSGGNLVAVIRRTSMIIGEKLDIQQEISVSIAQKKLESKLLCAAPIAIIAVLSFSSPDYMAPLYTRQGNLITTGAIILLVICFLWTRKLMNIKV